jgi:hypothetical protein
MRKALFVVLLAALLLAIAAPLASTAQADGPWGYGYGYVFPGSGYNKVCMYSAWNCSYRFVPPPKVSGYYKFPYNTYFTPYSGHKSYSGHYNPANCTPGLLCNSY